MIVTIISLKKEGDLWTNAATIQITEEEVATLSAIATAKASFVKVPLGLISDTSI